MSKHLINFTSLYDWNPENEGVEKHNWYVDDIGVSIKLITPEEEEFIYLFYQAEYTSSSNQVLKTIFSTRTERK